MNIDDLTIGQVKDLAALFAAPSESSEKHPFIGKYVICRCSAAGVHAGTLASVDGDAVILSDSRRLWSWTAKSGVALSGVAQHGLKSGKVDATNPEIYLLGMCEIIPCSPVAKESIENA